MEFWGRIFIAFSGRICYNAANSVYFGEVGVLFSPLFLFNFRKTVAVGLDVEHLRGLVEPILHSLGYELVGLAYAGHGGKDARYRPE